MNFNNILFHELFLYPTVLSYSLQVYCIIHIIYKKIIFLIIMDKKQRTYFIEQIKEHAYNILKSHYHISVSARVSVIFDTETELSQMLKEGFELAIQQHANSYDLYDYATFDHQAYFDDLDWNARKGDIAILIQSTSFRSTKFRFRNDLCNRGLKVIEFGHLHKVLEEEYQTYIDSLKPEDKRIFSLVDSLVEELKNIKSIEITSINGSVAKYSGPMDFATTNDGRYEGQTNYGSRYPIGEVISEALDLSTLNGEIEVYAFPSIEGQLTQFVEPFTVKIEDGFVVGHNGPKEFNDLIELIKTEHPKEKVYVREFGLGLNRNIPRHSRIGDPIAYERQEGLHFSLGMKHGIYQKKLWPKYGKKFKQKFHIDVYVNAKSIKFNEKEVYRYPQGFVL